MPYLGVQRFHLELVPSCAVADAALERPCRLIQKLLLPGVNLVRTHLIAQRQIGHPCKKSGMFLIRASRSCPR